MWLATTPSTPYRQLLLAQPPAQPPANPQHSLHLGLHFSLHLYSLSLKQGQHQVIHRITHQFLHQVHYQVLHQVLHLLSHQVYHLQVRNEFLNHAQSKPGFGVLLIQTRPTRGFVSLGIYFFRQHSLRNNSQSEVLIVSYEGSVIFKIVPTVIMWAYEKKLES